MGYTRKECERLVMSAERDGKILFFQDAVFFAACVVTSSLPCYNLYKSAFITQKG